MGNVCFKAESSAGKHVGAKEVGKGDVAKGQQPDQAESAAPAKALDVVAGKVHTKGGKPCLDTAGINLEMIQNVLDPTDGPAKGLPYAVHYLGPPQPPCEEQRVATMKALDKIHPANDDDPEIASILRLTASMFQAPVALVALFDEKRVYVAGSEGGVIPVGDFPWRWTLCAWSLAYNNPQILVIPDTLQDSRFSENDKVTGYPGVRFYCGTPLIASNGHRLGTLCFADVSPRPGFDAGSCSVMNNLSELVVRHLEKDIALKLKQRDNDVLQATYGQLQRTLDCFEHCVVLIDTSVDGWRILHTNSAWAKLTGVERAAVMGKPLRDVFEGLQALQLPTAELVKAAQRCHDFQVTSARLKLDSALGTPKGGFALTFRPAAREGMDDSTVPIGIPSFLQVKGASDTDVNDKGVINSGGHASSSSNTVAPTARRFYFMSVDLMTSQKNRGSVLSSASGPSSVLTWSSGLMSDVVEGLELGHLLGRGSFGSVYYGTWMGTSVAVKVIDQDLTKLPALGAGLAAPEAVLGQQLRHPNIVATLKYAARHIERPKQGGMAIASNNIETGGGSRPPVEGTAGTGNTLGTTDTADVANATDSATTSSAFAGAGNPAVLWPVINFDANNSSCMVGENTAGSEAVSHDWNQLVGSLKDPLTKSDGCAITSGGMNPHGSGMHRISEDGNQQVQTWILMEYCDKGCLQEAIDRGWLRTERSALHGGPNMAAVLVTAREIASALAYLHSAQVVHGDLSGWNVMLCASGSAATEGGRGFVAKVADFGMSRTLEIRSKIQTSNYGTLTHMPPETILKGTISKAVDVYSFGVLLWQLYTGSRPWSGLRHSQLIMMIGKGEAKLQFPEGTPPEYEALCQECMSLDPDCRPPFDQIIKRLQAM